MGLKEMFQVLASLTAAACLSAGFCVILRPLLLRYALARPNARSSHKMPTPQGGGIAVLLGTFGSALLVGAPALPGLATFGSVLAASLVLAALGAWDDIRPLPAYFRLGVQFACVGALLLPIMPEQRLLAGIPAAAEGFLVVLAGVWFVNLTNFMDGIDWLTVVCAVPATLFLGLLGLSGRLDPVAAALALGLCGGLIGFAPANRPVARLFLGDVGSLPIGLLLAFLLYRLAVSGAWVAALLLPLYSVCDATFTLLRRLIRGERIWEAHRSHIYQRATDRGFSVMSVCLHLLCLNLVLCGLALLSIWSSRLDVGIAALAAGLCLTLALMRHFSRSRGNGEG